MDTSNLHASLVNTCPNNLSGMSAQLFLTLLNTLIATQCYFKSDIYPPDYGPKLKNGDTFDFIVVGGGSSGSVVANRLSENPNWNVLLLEAGGRPSTTSEIPSLLFSLQGTDEDWKYLVEPSDDFCQGIKGKQCRWPRGKVLGGCSAINAMLYIRGNKRDYDKWAEVGNPGWDYESVWPYFLMSENATDENLKKSGEYGTEGYLPLKVYDPRQPIANLIFKGTEELGYPTTHTEKPAGFMFSPMNIKDGERINIARAFLGSVKDRKNLHVALNAHVTKVIIDEKTKTATGVKVQIGNQELIINAKKEVILSAGAINTPQLLMLSGIGPKKHLESLGIKTLADLPVGKNLQDHLIFPGLIVKIDDSTVRNLEALDKINEIYKYFMYREGELAEISVTNLVGFMNTRKDSPYPNLQFHHILNLKHDDYLIHEILRCAAFVDEFSKDHVDLNKKNFTVQFLPTLLNPKSAGEVLLRSSDPKDPPLIYANYFKDEDDLQVMLEGVRFIEELLKTKAFAEAKPEIYNIDIPNCRSLVFDSDEYWKCAIRNVAITLYHPVGTAKMGPKSDPTTVVDSTLKVHGINHLRVMDASIMPTITSGNTNAPCMMIAQKGSTMVIEEWKKKEPQSQKVHESGGKDRDEL